MSGAVPVEDPDPAELAEGGTVEFSEAMALAGARGPDVQEESSVPSAVGPASYWRAVDETLALVTQDVGVLGRARDLFAELWSAMVDTPWDGLAGVFVWPACCDAGDAAYEEAGRSIAELARQRFDETRRRGLNAQGVATIRELLRNVDGFATVAEDLDRLDRMCEDGVAIEPADDFVFKPVLAKLRRRYASNLAHLNEGVVGRVEKGEVIVLRDAGVDWSEAGIHMSAMHASPKDGDPNGRPIWDCGDMNSEEALAKGVAKYGALTLPTVLDTVAKAVEASEFYAEDVAAGDVMVAIQVDITGAFQKIKVAPDSVARTGLRLSDGRLMFHLTGFFGWCTFPIVWGVVTRVILAAAVASGVLFILGYVDDFTVFTTESRAEEVLQKLLWVIETLLGPEAVNRSKTIFKVRRLVVQGWLVDFGGVAEQSFDEVSVGGTVAMSDKNLRKSLFQLLNLPEIMSARRNVIESMVSRGLRNSLVHRQLRPCVMCWAAVIRGLERDVVKELGPSGSTAVVLWRVFLCKNLLWPERFGRTFGSFTERIPRVLVTFDACPVGVGVICAYVNGHGDMGTIFNITWIRFDKLRFRFAADVDPSFQNTAEFLGAVIACLILIRLGFRRVTYILKGDSIVALTWACAFKAQEGRSQRSAMLFAGASLAAGVLPARTFWQIPGDNNGVDDNFEADLISRGGDNGKKEAVDLTRRYPPGVFVVGHEEPWIKDALEAVDPEAGVSSARSLGSWSQAQGVIEEAMARESSIPEEILSDYRCLQFFISRPAGSTVVRGAWVLRLPRSATMADILKAVRKEYPREQEEVSEVYLLRLSRFYSDGDGESSWEQCGLVSGDALEVRNGRKGPKRARSGPSDGGGWRPTARVSSWRGRRGEPGRWRSAGVARSEASADNGALLAGPAFRGDVAGDGAPSKKMQKTGSSADADGAAKKPAKGLSREALSLQEDVAKLFARVLVCNSCDSLNKRDAGMCTVCYARDTNWAYETSQEVAAQRAAALQSTASGPPDRADSPPPSASSSEGGEDDSMSDLTEEAPDDRRASDNQLKRRRKKRKRTEARFPPGVEADQDPEIEGERVGEKEKEVDRVSETEGTVSRRCKYCKHPVPSVQWAAICLLTTWENVRCGGHLEAGKRCRRRAKTGFWEEVAGPGSPPGGEKESVPPSGGEQSSADRVGTEKVAQLSKPQKIQKLNIDDVRDLAKKPKDPSDSGLAGGVGSTAGAGLAQDRAGKASTVEADRTAPRAGRGQRASVGVKKFDKLAGKGQSYAVKPSTSSSIPKKTDFTAEYAAAAAKFELRVENQISGAKVYVAESHYAYKDAKGELKRLRYGLFVGADVPRWTAGELTVLTVLKGRVLEEDERRGPAESWSVSALDGGPWAGAILDSEEEAVHLRELASFINDPRNLFHWPSGEPVVDSTSNVAIASNADGVLCLVPRRNLVANEELLRCYGPKYEMLADTECPALRVGLPTPPAGHKDLLSPESPASRVDLPPPPAGQGGTLSPEAPALCEPELPGLPAPFEAEQDFPCREKFPTISAFISSLSGREEPEDPAWEEGKIHVSTILSGPNDSRDRREAALQAVGANGAAGDTRPRTSAALGVQSGLAEKCSAVIFVEEPDPQRLLTANGERVEIRVFELGSVEAPAVGTRTVTRPVAVTIEAVKAAGTPRIVWFPAAFSKDDLRDWIVWMYSSPRGQSGRRRWHRGIEIRVAMRPDTPISGTIENVVSVVVTHSSFGPGFSSDNAGDGPASGGRIRAVYPGNPAEDRGEFFQLGFSCSGEPETAFVGCDLRAVFVRRFQAFENVVETIIWRFATEESDGTRTHGGITVERVNTPGYGDLLDLLSIQQMVVVFPERPLAQHDLVTVLDPSRTGEGPGHAAHPAPGAESQSVPHETSSHAESEKPARRRKRDELLIVRRPATLVGSERARGGQVSGPTEGRQIIALQALPRGQAEAVGRPTVFDEGPRETGKRKRDTPGRDVVFSEEQERSLSTGLSVTAKTMKGYDKSFRLWSDFLTTKLEKSDDPFLETWGSRTTKVKVIGLFIQHLGNTLEYRKTRIENICAGIKKVFVSSVKEHELWEHPSVSHWKGTFRGLARDRERSRRVRRKRKPTTTRILKRMKEEANTEDPGTDRQVLRKRRCTYLACQAMYLFGARYCAIGATPAVLHEASGVVEPANKHTLTCADIEFAVEDQVLGLTGYTEFLVRTYGSASRESVTASLDAIVVHLDSDKVFSKKGRIESIKVGETNDPEGAALRTFGIDLACWVLFENGKAEAHLARGPGQAIMDPENNLVFSLAYVKVRAKKDPLVYEWNVQRKDMTSAVKSAATHFGLDASDYSVYSLRHGAISNMADRGDSILEIQEFCNHQPGSTSTDGYIELQHRARPPLLDSGNPPRSSAEGMSDGAGPNNMSVPSSANDQAASEFLVDLSASLTSNESISLGATSISQSSRGEPRRRISRFTDAGTSVLRGEQTDLDPALSPIDDSFRGTPYSFFPSQSSSPTRVSPKATRKRARKVIVSV